MNPAQSQSDLLTSTESASLAQKLPPVGTYPIPNATQPPQPPSAAPTPGLNSFSNPYPQPTTNQVSQQTPTAINFGSMLTDAPPQPPIQVPQIPTFSTLQEESTNQPAQSQAPSPDQDFKITDVKINLPEPDLQASSAMAIPTGPSLGLPPIPSGYGVPPPTFASTQEADNTEEVQHEVELASPQQILQEAQDTLNLPLAQNNPDLHAAIIRAAEDALSEVFKKNKT